MTQTIKNAHNISVIRRFLKLTLISFVIAFALFLVLPSYEDQVQENIWVLSQARDFFVDEKVKITLVFDHKTLSGYTGINHYSASYHLNGNYLQKSDFYITEIASINPIVNEMEALYMKSLGQSQSILFERDDLILLDENQEERLRYTKEQ